MQWLTLMDFLKYSCLNWLALSWKELRVYCCFACSNPNVSTGLMHSYKNTKTIITPC